MLESIIVRYKYHNEMFSITFIFREYIDLLDGVSILVRSSSSESARILSRSLFELYLSIMYIFEKDTKLYMKVYIEIYQ